MFRSTQPPTMPRYAILLNAGPAAVGPPVNALQYALELDDHGHDVSVFLDGPATKWPDELGSMADHPLRAYYDEARERSLIAGACAFCAHRYGADGPCRDEGLRLFGGPDEHGPDVGRLATDGYRLLTVG